MIQNNSFSLDSDGKFLEENKEAFEKIARKLCFVHGVEYVGLTLVEAIIDAECQCWFYSRIEELWSRSFREIGNYSQPNGRCYLIAYKREDATFTRPMNQLELLFEEYQRKCAPILRYMDSWT